MTGRRLDSDLEILKEYTVENLLNETINCVYFVDETNDTEINHKVRKECDFRYLVL